MARLLYRGFAAILGFSVLALPVRAGEPADPLRLAPDGAEFLIKVEQPSQIVQLVESFVNRNGLQGLSFFREAYSSTTAVRIQQVIGYFEKRLGKSRYELIEPLFGGGAVLAGKINTGNVSGEDNIVLVVQGKDAALMQKFAATAMELIEQELARQELPTLIQKQSYKGIEIVTVVNQLRFALLESTFVGSVKEDEIKAAIDRHFDKTAKGLEQKADVVRAKELLPKNTLAWAWVTKIQAVKDVLDAFNGEPVIRVPFGGLLDVATRSEFLVFALSQDDKGPAFSIHFPKGRDGMNEAVTGHVPAADQPGVLPLLKPNGALLSSSFYLDFKHLWEKRAELFKPKPEQLKDIEEAEKNSGRVLLGTRVSQLLSYMGARHRFVALAPTASAKDGGAALVLELREPEKFSKAAELPLRSLGLILGFAVKLKMVEEKHGDYKIVGYKLPPELKQQTAGNPFGAIVASVDTPCFVRVGSYFVVSSNFELAHQLIDDLEKEAKQPHTTRGGPSTRTQLWFDSVAKAAEAGREETIAQTILGQGISPAEANEQFTLLLGLLAKLGFADGSIHCDKDSYRLEARLVLPQ